MVISAPSFMIAFVYIYHIFIYSIVSFYAAICVDDVIRVQTQ